MTRLQFHSRTMIIDDEAMGSTLRLASAAGRSPAPVLLCGESGTGKELIARYIHEKSARAKGPFVTVNCAAIPENLMEAELFGFERGAFTGAVSQRIGKFEQATNGTLLLDEISEMPIGLQAKLLRVLQEREIDRLGGSRPVPIQTRVIATTNRDLNQLILDDKFREDLFYRINVIRIECTPLRARPSSILSLAREFAQCSSEAQGWERVPEISEEACDRLLGHDWPGNIRELQNVVEKAVLLSEGERLLPEHIHLFRSLARPALQVEFERLETVEQRHILKVLEGTGGHRNQAADILGISARTLRNKLKLYGM